MSEIHPAQTYHQARRWAGRAMQSEYVLSELLSQAQGHDWDDNSKAGLVSEMLFYHKFREEMDLVWALDCGDHTDFVSIRNKWRIDVTGSLWHKRYEPGKESYPENMMFFEAWLPSERSLGKGTLTCKQALIGTNDGLENRIQFRGIRASSLKTTNILNNVTKEASPYWDKGAGKSLIKSEILWHLREKYCDRWNNLGIEEEYALECLTDYEDELYDFVSQNYRKKSVLPEDLAVHANSLFKRQGKSGPGEPILKTLQHTLIV